jgi:hypothetical protein
MSCTVGLRFLVLRRLCRDEASSSLESHASGEKKIAFHGWLLTTLASRHTTMDARLGGFEQVSTNADRHICGNGEMGRDID